MTDDFIVIMAITRPEADPEKFILNSKHIVSVKETCRAFEFVNNDTATIDARYFSGCQITLVNGAVLYSEEPFDILYDRLTKVEQAALR